MNEPKKVCPRCQQAAPLPAAVCVSCGHTFRTQFPTPQPPDQTQMLNQSPALSQAPIPYSPPPVYPPPPQVPPEYRPYPPPYGLNPNGLSPDSIQVTPGMHPVALVGLLGFLCVPGLAQMVNRQYLKGVVVFFSVSVAIGATFFLAGLGGAVVGLAAAIDALCVANRLNRGEIIGPWTSF